MSASSKPSVRPVVVDQIPSELRERQQWVCWRWTKKRDRWDKPPLQPNGRPASHSDPATWSSFQQAFAAVADGRLDGVGYVFSECDPYMGIDLDDCRDPVTGQLSAHAEFVMQRANSYAETSPSGCGLKIFLRGRLPAGSRKDDERGVEIYDRTRYFCVTGERISAAPPAIRAVDEGEVRQLLGLLFPNREVASRAGQVSDARATALAALAGLSSHRAHGYHDWLAVGMALHSVDPSESMCEEWDVWSRQAADKYEPGACQKKWASFDRPVMGRVLSVGSLVHCAVQDGWTPPWKRNGQSIASRVDGSSHVAHDDAVLVGGLTLTPSSGRRTNSGKLVLPISIVRDADTIDSIEITSSNSGRKDAERRVAALVPGIDMAVVSTAVGRLIVGAQQRLTKSSENDGPTVRAIVTERVTAAFQLAYRVKHNAWSEARACEIGRPEFITFTPEWLVNACVVAVDCPRDNAGHRNEAQLVRKIESALKILWPTLVSELPDTEADAGLTEQSEAGERFRQAMVHLWTVPKTFELTTFETRVGAEHRAARASLASRVATQLREPVRVNRSQIRNGWMQVQTGFDAWFRCAPGDGVFLAMRYTLCGQIGVNLPGVVDQTSLTRLGGQYGAVIKGTPPVSDRLSDGSRLAILTPEMTDAVRAEPASDDATDTDSPVSEENFVTE